MCLVIGFVLITATWNENYGSPSVKGVDAIGGCASVDKPLSHLKKDIRIQLIGIIVSLFEGSM